MDQAFWDDVEKKRRRVQELSKVEYNFNAKYFEMVTLNTTVSLLISQWREQNKTNS